MYCRDGFKKDANGCDICECDLGICSEVQCPAEKICRGFRLDHSGHKISKCIDPTLPPKCWGVGDMGNGKEKLTRYFYNGDTEECDVFQYTGQGGNENRFISKEICLGTCIKGLCDSVQCMMECGSLGFKEDRRGCQMCECNDPPPVPTAQPGNACPDVLCAMYCEYGNVRDNNGCEICQCREAPATELFTPNEGCRVKQCKMFCELGFEEVDGCPICRCKEPSCPEIMCAMYCEYGFLRGENGCPVCTCAADPCTFIADTCPADRPRCKSFKRSNERWEPRCIGSKERDRFWCSPITCMMECENEFTNDKYGCSICECREEPKKECPMMKCGGDCEYGYKYGNDGCRGCDCLPDPCLTYKCGMDEVCEAYREREPRMRGSTIPAMPKCIPDLEVQRLEIELKYNYDSAYELFEHEEEFQEELSASIGRMMYIDDEYIRGISVRSSGPAECSVTFNLISFGNLNLVDALDVLREKLAEVLDSSFDCGGTQFTPIEDSVEARYYSDPDITVKVQPTLEPEGSNALFIIIGCTVGGIVAIAAIIGIIVAVVRTRKSHKQARKDIAYSKVKKASPTRRPDSRPTSQRPVSERPKSENAGSQA